MTVLLVRIVGLVSTFQAFQHPSPLHPIFRQAGLSSSEIEQICEICLRNERKGTGLVSLPLAFDLFLEVASKVFGDDVGTLNNFHGHPCQIGDVCAEGGCGDALHQFVKEDKLEQPVSINGRSA